MTYGEGPTQMPKAGYFMEDAEVQYTAEDIRYTARGDILYATCLGWPTGPVRLRTLAKLYPGEVRTVRMLGVDQELAWSAGPEGLVIIPPAEKPCEHAFSFKIERQDPFDKL
jgi:alpha-L-fucosidase